MSEDGLTGLVARVGSPESGERSFFEEVFVTGVVFWKAEFRVCLAETGVPHRSSRSVDLRGMWSCVCGVAMAETSLGKGMFDMGARAEPRFSTGRQVKDKWRNRWSRAIFESQGDAIATLRGPSVDWARQVA